MYYIHSMSIGGAETLVCDYLIELKRRHVDVALIVNYLSDSFLEKKIKKEGIIISPIFLNNKSIVARCYNLGLKHSSIPGKRIEKILETFKPDVFHIHTATNYLYNVNFSANKMVYTFHSNVGRYINLLGQVNEKNLKYLSKKGMHFVAISKCIENDIYQYLGTKNVTYIPNGLDIENFRKQKVFRQETRSFYKIEDNTLLVGHVGRFNKVKNHERIIEIFEEIHKQQENSKLILVGGDDNGNLDHIKQIVSQKKLSQHVIFAGICDKVARIISAMDVMLIPSFSESFSLTIIEAQSLGVRCIASDNLPIEVFCNNNCFRLSLNEPNSRWSDLALNEEKCQWENNLSDFELENVIDKTINLYERIIEK